MSTRYGTCNRPRHPNHTSPPPYEPIPQAPAPQPRMMPYYHDSEETTLFLRTHHSREGGNHAKCGFLHWVFTILFILIVASLIMAIPMVSSVVRHEMIEWERVHDEMLRDIGKLRVEKLDILDEVQQLRIERDEMRREWELEREENEKRRRDHAPFWGEPRLLTEQCPGDRHRRYEARMYNLLVEDDWFAACMRESIQIAGRTFASPQSCINRGLDNGVRGFWSFEVNTHECPRTIWDRLRNIFG